MSTTTTSTTSTTQPALLLPSNMRTCTRPPTCSTPPTHTLHRPPQHTHTQTTSLFCRGEILPTHPRAARAKLRRLLAAAGVRLRERAAVAEVLPRALRLEAEGGGGDNSSGDELAPFDECLWCTQAAAAGWLASTGLPLDAGGFVAIDECLRADPSLGGPGNVFAAGDVAGCAAHPRPKAGVFAVRQGPPLAENLRRWLAGQPLVPFRPQATFLSLISAGGSYAVGTKGPFAFEGAWAWTWKDRIDRAFMDKYGAELPFEKMAMAAAQGAMGGAGGGAAAADGGAVYAAAGPGALALLAAAKMRCGGCGAKVGAGALARALARLDDWMRAQQQQQPGPDAAAAVAAADGKGSGKSGVAKGGSEGGDMRVLLGVPSGADDAAVLAPPPAGHVVVQTVDFFRSLWGDPFVFGRIAANHALGVRP